MTRKNVEIKIFRKKMLKSFGGSEKSITFAPRLEKRTSLRR